MFDLGLQESTRQTEEDDAGVGEALVEDQLPKIAIGNHQNALLVAGNGKDILVSKAVWVVLGNGRDIVAEVAKMRDEAMAVSMNFGLARKFEAAATLPPVPRHFHSGAVRNMRRAFLPHFACYVGGDQGA
jgi:hypothetical protein